MRRLLQQGMPTKRLEKQSQGTVRPNFFSDCGQANRAFLQQVSAFDCAFVFLCPTETAPDGRRGGVKRFPGCRPFGTRWWFPDYQQRLCHSKRRKLVAANRHPTPGASKCDFMLHWAGKDAGLVAQYELHQAGFVLDVSRIPSLNERQKALQEVINGHLQAINDMSKGNWPDLLKAAKEGARESRVPSDQQHS